MNQFLVVAKNINNKCYIFRSHLYRKHGKQISEETNDVEDLNLTEYIGYTSTDDEPVMEDIEQYNTETEWQ